MTIRIQRLWEDHDNCVLSSILADPRQRRVLSILLERPHPLTDRDLAVRLATREGTPPSDVTEEDLQGLLVDLHHRYLPKLETVGWIERRPEGIVTTEQLSFGNPDSSLPPLTDPDCRWDVLAALLARPRRRHVLSILVAHDRPLSLDELVTELATREQISWTVDEGEALSRSAVLHHVDLPRLDEIGLITYDDHEKTIAPERALDTLEEWIALDDPDGDHSTVESGT